MVRGRRDLEAGSMTVGIAMPRRDPRTEAANGDWYRPAELLTQLCRATPHERRRAFALASGQNIRPLV